MIFSVAPYASKAIGDKMTDSSFVRPGGELQLSNLGQLELLRGLVERGKTIRTHGVVGRYLLIP